MKFSIGAIFKDEIDYIFEWLAWHRLAGFPRFFIADNGSSDGTRQLLEALSEAGFIDIFYISPQTKAQLLAYKTILNVYGKEVDAIAFIDADEFIYADNGILPVHYLESLFSDKNVAAVGINWRIFGSSGKKNQEKELVIERFLKCAHDEHHLNLYIKSVIKPSLTHDVFVHHSIISNGFSYINSNKKNISFLNAEQVLVKNATGISAEISREPLRINHYIIKSLQEFTEKKRKRGDAMISPTHERTDRYFEDRDLNDVTFYGASLLAESVSQEIEAIKLSLHSKSPYYENSKGSFHCNATYIAGWAVFETKKPKIMVFVNGKLQVELEALDYRHDILELGISKDGLCGFYYEFLPNLAVSDVVDVSVYANPFRFELSPVVIKNS